MNDADMAEILRTLGQETRLRIFRLLAQSPEPGLSSGFISASVDVAPALASFHLKELSRAGLLNKQLAGRFTIYSVNRVQLELLAARLAGEWTLAGPTRHAAGDRNAPANDAPAAPATRSPARMPR